MPRDKRLYMTFPIDMHRHPKLTRLPADVRWTFVEMNGEARIAENDGVFKAEEAEFMWPVEHLKALVASHPTKPLVAHDGNTYVIREYPEHQFTREDREELSAKRAEAGRKGGQALAKQLLSKPEQTQAESESGLEIDNQDLGASSYVPNAPAGDDDGLSHPKYPKPLRGGGLDLNRVDAAVSKFTARAATDMQLQAIVDAVMGRATGKITAQTSFVVRAIENDWAEWQTFIDSGRAAL